MACGPNGRRSCSISDLPTFAVPDASDKPNPTGLWGTPGAHQLRERPKVLASARCHRCWSDAFGHWRARSLTDLHPVRLTGQLVRPSHQWVSRAAKSTDLSRPRRRARCGPSTGRGRPIRAVPSIQNALRHGPGCAIRPPLVRCAEMWDRSLPTRRLGRTCRVQGRGSATSAGRPVGRWADGSGTCQPRPGPPISGCVSCLRGRRCLPLRSTLRNTSITRRAWPLGAAGGGASLGARR